MSFQSSINTDIELLAGLQQNDEKALASLMKNHYNALFQYAMRFANDEELVKDTIQEVFISVWQRRHTAETILSIKYYLLRAVKNKVLKALHKQRKEQLSPLAEGYNFEMEFSIEQQIVNTQVIEEKYRRLLNIVSRLSARQKEIIHLKFYQQLDNIQVAEMMSISQQSVYNLTHETIQKIKTFLQAEFIMKSIAAIGISFFA